MEALATAEERAFRAHLERPDSQLGTIGESAASSPTHQAALLTALNCARRTFLGGVTVSGVLDAPLTVPVVAGATLADAVGHLQGIVVEDIPQGVPLVSIGAPPAIDRAGFAIRTTFEGWRAGLVPFDAPALPDSAEFAPAGVLAGALAVSEVFAHFDGGPMAGYRSIGMSLWDLRRSADWRSPASDGPAVAQFPSDFWVIGLGHLGQALLWTIGLLPFADPSNVRMFLQDVDRAGPSTESTSVLTFATDAGRLKTRICADWAEARGFQSRMVERRFASDLRVGHEEPLLALCGVDNPQARAILEGAGFATVFEAGLGSGVEDFRLIRTHSFPAPNKALDIWADDPEVDEAGHQGNAPVALAGHPPAYKDLHDRGDLDECGLTRLGQVAVGAPFVGMIAAAILISQTIRMVADGVRPTVVNLDLRAPQHRSLVLREAHDIVLFGTAGLA